MCLALGITPLSSTNALGVTVDRGFEFLVVSRFGEATCYCKHNTDTEARVHSGRAYSGRLPGLSSVRSRARDLLESPVYYDLVMTILGTTPLCFSC